MTHTTQLISKNLNNPTYLERPKRSTHLERPDQLFQCLSRNIITHLHPKNSKSIHTKFYWRWIVWVWFEEWGIEPLRGSDKILDQNTRIIAPMPEMSIQRGNKIVGMATNNLVLNQCILVILVQDGIIELVRCRYKIWHGMVSSPCSAGYPYKQTRYPGIKRWTHEWG